MRILLPGLGLLMFLSLAGGCASGKRSYDYGQISSGAGGSFTVSAYGSTEREAEEKAYTAARLYCQENKRGQNAEFSERKMDYRGPFQNAEQHKMVTGVMESMGEGVKLRKGLGLLGPSASLDLDPEKTARQLSEDAFQISFTAVCRP